MLGKWGGNSNLIKMTTPQPSKEDFVQGGNKFLEAMLSEKEPYWIDRRSTLGMKLKVLPGVFSPKYFKDSDFFASVIPVMPGEDFLEIGSGTGIVSVAAALKGARYIHATDLNIQAVENTRQNLQELTKRKKDLKIKYIAISCGPVFSALHTDHYFDTIFWNVPFGYATFRPEDDAPLTEKTLAKRTIHDPGYHQIKRFIEEGKNYLKRDGRLLIGFSPEIGRQDILLGMLIENNYQTRTIARSLPMQGANTAGPIHFELYEARPRTQ